MSSGRSSQGTKWRVSWVHDLKCCFQAVMLVDFSNIACAFDDRRCILRIEIALCGEYVAECIIFHADVRTSCVEHSRSSQKIIDLAWPRMEKFFMSVSKALIGDVLSMFCSYRWGVWVLINVFMCYSYNSAAVLYCRSDIILSYPVLHPTYHHT